MMRNLACIIFAILFSLVFATHSYGSPGNKSKLKKGEVPLFKSTSYRAGSVSASGAKVAAAAKKEFRILINSPALNNNIGQSVIIDLPEGRFRTVIDEIPVEDRKQKRKVLGGRLIRAESGERVGNFVIIRRGAEVSGVFPAGAATYLLKTKGKKQVLSPVISEESLTDDVLTDHNHESDLTSRFAADRSLIPAAAATSSNPVVVDLMVVYTGTVKTRLGGLNKANDYISSMVALANQAFTDSQAHLRLRLVHTAEIASLESGDLTEDLNSLRGKTDGKWDNIHALRDTYKADLVSGLMAPAKGTGVGFLLNNMSLNTEWNAANNGFHALDYRAVPGHTFTHEIGHNLGLQHDRDNATVPPVFPNYSYGYRFSTPRGTFRDIMAYPPGVRLNLFSNPNILYDSAPVGQADYADGVRALNLTAPYVARYRLSGNEPAYIPPTPVPVFTATPVTVWFNITGRVTYNGAGLPGVIVSGIGNFTTGPDGRFSIKSVPAGTKFRINLSKSGYTFSPSSFESYLDRDMDFSSVAASTVPVTPTITPPPATGPSAGLYTLRGRVMFGGSGLSGVTVQATLYERALFGGPFDGRPYSRTITTDSGGYFTLDTDTGTGYHLALSKPGYVLSPRDIRGVAGSTEVNSNFSVTAALANKFRNASYTSTYFNDTIGYGSRESYWATLQYADLNGDGKTDVCGRASTGIICQLSNGSGFNPPKLWSQGTDFSDPQFRWGSDRSQYLTIKLVDLNGDGKADVCGRYEKGIRCALSTGTSFTPASSWSDYFNDAVGMGSVESYWSTLQFPDVNGDNRADICVRSSVGIICAVSAGNRFGGAAVWTPYFSNTTNPRWGSDPSLYKTIKYVDLNNDGLDDVCGRSPEGIVCGISNGSSFTDVRLRSAAFSDAAGFTNISRWSTIQFGDLSGDGKADVCGRTSGGILCGIFDGSLFSSGGIKSSYFSDSTDARWNSDPSYYRTLKLVDVSNDGRADICGRTSQGLVCAVSSGAAFGAAENWMDDLTDLRGYNNEPRWSGIHIVDVNGDGKKDICSRDALGLKCGWGYL